MVVYAVRTRESSNKSVVNKCLKYLCKQFIPFFFFLCSLITLGVNFRLLHILWGLGLWVSHSGTVSSILKQLQHCLGGLLQVIEVLKGELSLSLKLLHSETSCVFSRTFLHFAPFILVTTSRSLPLRAHPQHHFGTLMFHSRDGISRR